MNIQAYQAALDRAAYFFQMRAGFLRLSGADRFDFIQRQSTNDIHQLTTDQSSLTVLTSATARIVDVLCLFDEGKTLGMITLPERQESTAQFLQNRIFFSDQVSVSNVSSEYGQVLVVGPQARVILENLNIQPPPAKHVSTGDIGGQQVTVISREILSDPNYYILTPHSNVAAVMAALAQAGAESLDSETFDVLRVEAGQPGPAGELTSDYTPLEVGLLDLISGTKGCYTGQEIIARQITYDKVTKVLIGIKLEQYVDPGVALILGGKSIGTLTSVVKSPRWGVIGLGIVRKGFNLSDARLTAENAKVSANAEFAKLPFI